MNNTNIFSCVALLAVSAASAVDLPVVDNVRLSQVGSTRLVTVKYALTGADGIVTVDFLTNGVPIGTINYRNVAGDVNRLVANGSEDKVITWRPDESWPGLRIPLAQGGLTARVTAWSAQTPPDYTVFNLIDGSRNYYVDEDALPFGIESDVYRTTQLVMRRIHAANVEWVMGSPSTEKYRSTSETPHHVTLTCDYYMSVFEFTQGQLEAVSGSRTVNGYTPYFGGTRYAVRPVENMRFQVFNGTFMPTLRTRLGLDTNLRAPYEAEWEYACRAGVATALPSGKWTTVASGTDEDPNITEIARCMFNAKPGGQAPAADCDPDVGGTARVGSYPANAWGLYDMIGNVMEQCADKYESYPAGSVVDPGTAAVGSDKMNVRGGGWSLNGQYCRSASRNYYDQYAANNILGFRVCLRIQ